VSTLRVHRSSSRLLLVLLVSVSAALVAAEETWSVRSEPPGPGASARCVLVSPRQDLHDGYQTTWAQILVDGTAVRVTSQSNLDSGDGDIGLVVDAGTFVPSDEVVDRRTAVFTSRYEAVVEQFRRGGAVRVQLRFWPEWPKTGTHSATFSLIGFTRAYGRLSECRTP
jgi:hypothetical protein